MVEGRHFGVKDGNLFAKEAVNGKEQRTHRSKNPGEKLSQKREALLSVAQREHSSVKAQMVADHCW